MDLISNLSKELLHEAIDQDSPDSATAERAKARIADVAGKLREYVSADAEQRARASYSNKGFPVISFSDPIPDGYTLPQDLGMEIMDVLRELSTMGITVHVFPDELSVERRYRQYIVDVCKSAWTEGVARVSDRLTEYLNSPPPPTGG